MNESYEPTQEDLAQLVRDCERMQSYDMTPEDLLRMARDSSQSTPNDSQNLQNVWWLRPHEDLRLSEAFTFEPKPSRLVRAMTWVRGIFK
jgi:hypothetical protein